MHPAETASCRILIACTAQGEPILRRALEPLQASIVCALSKDSAIREMERGVDLAVCSLRFDESRMLEFVADVARKRPRLPFVCCRVLASDLPEASLRGAFAAAGHLGAVAVLNLPELAQREGEALAEAALRDAVALHLHDLGHASIS